MNEKKKLKKLGDDFKDIFYDPGQDSFKFKELPQKDEKPVRNRVISNYSLIDPELCLNVCDTEISAVINSVFSKHHDSYDLLLTAKTDNQNTKLDMLVELRPTYIYKVSGKKCIIVTSIYYLICMAFYNVVIRLTDKQFGQIDENSMFKIVFNELDDNYVKTSSGLVKSQQEKKIKGELFTNAFYEILEKCINIYVIIKT